MTKMIGPTDRACEEQRVGRLRDKRTISILLLFSVFCVSLLLRLNFASMARHPGHADYAFYYTVAENIVDGKGFQIDYIWHYLAKPEAISHSSNDYWMPLPSIIISASMFVFGKSLFAALLPSVLAGWALALLTYLVSSIYSSSRLVAFCSSSLVLFAPFLFKYSLLTDSAIFYALFVSASLFCMIKGFTTPRFYLLSSAFAGLAHLTRQDGALLVPVLVGMILLSQQSRKEKLLYLSVSLGVYFLFLAPLVASNCLTFGTPFPAGPSKTVFFTQPQDLYAYSKELALHSYLAWGWSNIMLSKVVVAFSNIKTLYTQLGEFVSIFAVIGILRFTTSVENRQRWTTYAPPLLFLGILFAFYTLIATFPGGQGGFLRSSMAAVPFLIVIAVDAVDRIASSKKVVALSMLLLALLFASRAIYATEATISFNTYLGEQLAVVKEVITSDAHEQGYEKVVIMTRNPWEVYHSTRYKAIQIPSEGLETICQAAREYGANYLLLFAPEDTPEPLYSEKVLDARFQFVTSIPNSDLELFRIRLEAGEPRRPTE